MIALFRLLTRWEWDYRLVLKTMMASGASLFPVVTLWPQDTEYITVICFASNEFQWNSCLSAYRA